MKYKIEFELPDNEVVQKEIKHTRIKWMVWGYDGYAKAIPSADRPQGEWIDEGRNLWGCSNCGMEIYSESERDRNEFHKWCSRCGARMKGADDAD